MTWEHWEVLLLTPIMLLDHSLTILGARMSERRYANHFRSEHYELNPVWQSAIRTKRWFNPRHHILAIAIPIALFYLEQATPQISAYYGPLNAGLLSLYSMILGQHLCNLLVFRRLDRRPGEVSGSVTMSHPFVLENARYRAFVCAFPLVVAAALSRHPLAIGAALGPAFYLLSNFVWSARRKSGKNPAQGPAAPPDQPGEPSSSR